MADLKNLLNQQINQTVQKLNDEDEKRYKRIKIQRQIDEYTKWSSEWPTYCHRNPLVKDEQGYWQIKVDRKYLKDTGTKDRLEAELVRAERFMNCQ